MGVTNQIVVIQISCDDRCDYPPITCKPLPLTPANWKMDGDWKTSETRKFEGYFSWKSKGSPWKSMVERLVFFWDDQFSGAMLVLGSVYLI